VAGVIDTDLDVGVLLITLGLLICIAAGVLGGTRPKPRHRQPSVRATRSLTLVHHGPTAPFLVMSGTATGHAGATEDWSPKAHVAAADTPEATLQAEADRERRELATARAELQPHIDVMHKALGVAFAQFDAATRQASRTAEIWHTLNVKACQVCGERHAQTFGPARSDPHHTIIRSFRIDTPTGEYPAVQLSTMEA
jgi:hypothetical protein